MTERATVLVTGNRGYIGVEVTRCLRTSGYRVVGLDSLLYEGAGCAPIDVSADLQMAKDVRDVGVADLEGVQAIVHLAGLSNDPLGDLAEPLTHDINHRASVRLAALAKQAGVERFVFASSCSIYGIAPGDRALSETDPVGPATAYARSKVRVEQEVSQLADSRFHPIFMRNATVYGFSPSLRLDLVVNNLVAFAMLTGRVSVLSDGTPWRPLVHIQDLCGFVCAFLQAPLERVSNHAFNVGADADNYTVRQIAETVCEEVPDCTLEILNVASPDQRTYRVDFAKVRAALPKFRPQWSLRAGIADLREAYSRCALKPIDLEAPKYFRLRWINALLRSQALSSDLRWVNAEWQQAASTV